MSNLGGYQTITTLIKRVGGPEVAVKLAGAAGVFLLVAGGAAYAGAQKATPAVKQKAQQLFEKWKSQGGRPDELAGSTYTVTSAVVDEQGLVLDVGTVFRVLEKDGDAVLIEIDDNDDNPWFVSADLLARISDFPID